MVPSSNFHTLSLSSPPPMATLSAFSFHPTTTSRFSLPLSQPTATFLLSATPKSSLLSLSSHSAKPITVRCQLSGEVEDSSEPQAPLYPPAPSEEYTATGSFIDGLTETEDEIALAYEELYGPAFSGVSYLGNDVNVMDSKVKRSVDWTADTSNEKVKDGLEERVIQVRRVTKVVEGGKQLNFRAVMVVGDKKGHVGVGVGKAKEVTSAVQKAALDARRNVTIAPMTKYLTFPHRADGKFGGALVMLRPACPGTGVIAGGAVKAVLELAGFENALGKQIRSKNILNNARATIMALQKMRLLRQVAEERGIPMEQLFGFV